MKPKLINGKWYYKCPGCKFSVSTEEAWYNKKKQWHLKCLSGKKGGKYAKKEI